ncbi:MAG: hypothetical protein EHJ95_02165 [Methanobacteriota archaeon]|nr:MAG: hypothetical protein EHJ95_02165 [Euryarchaeota archaeon]
MRPVYILLEGNDDERFFQRIVAPLLASKRYQARIWLYACEKRARTAQFLKAVRASGNVFILVRDIDEAPSVAAKKRELIERYDHFLSSEDIAVVVMEIESWYLAGADPRVLAKWGIGVPPGTTDRITKEDFNSLIPRRLSRIVFMQEILRHYDVGAAMQRNASFRYFMHRFVDPRVDMQPPPVTSGSGTPDAASPYDR